MKRSALIILMATLFSAISLNGHELYRIYENSRFNYKIVIPRAWSRYDIDMRNKHIMYVAADKNTEIKIRAIISSERNVEHALHDKKWDLRALDSRLNEIIETEKIRINKNIAGKLLVFEYTNNRRKFLQRVMVTRNGDITYIIECRSPQATFYKFDYVFNTVFASFAFITPGESETDIVDDKDRVIDPEDEQI